MKTPAVALYQCETLDVPLARAAEISLVLGHGPDQPRKGGEGRSLGRGGQCSAARPKPCVLARVRS